MSNDVTLQAVNSDVAGAQQAEEIESYAYDANVEWEDITKLIEEGTGKLNVGEIVHGEQFSLLEAMSSIKLMDPKIDFSMDTENILILSEVKNANLLPSPCELSLENWVYMFDRWISTESMYFSGFCLAQSLLVSYHLQDVSGISGAPFYQSLAETLILRCVLCYENLLLARNFNFEEFVSFDFGFDLSCGLEYAQVVKRAQLELEAILDHSNQFPNYIQNFDLYYKKKVITNVNTKHHEEHVECGGDCHHERTNVMNAGSLSFINEEERSFLLIEPDEAKKALFIRLKLSLQLLQLTMGLNVMQQSSKTLDSSIDNSCTGLLRLIGESRELMGLLIGTSNCAIKPDTTRWRLFEPNLVKRICGVSTLRTFEWPELQSVKNFFDKLLEGYECLICEAPSVRTLTDAFFFLDTINDKYESLLLVRSRVFTWLTCSVELKSNFRFQSLWWNPMAINRAVTWQEVLRDHLEKVFNIPTYYLNAGSKLMDSHLKLTVVSMHEYLRSAMNCKARFRRNIVHIMNEYLMLVANSDSLQNRINSVTRRSSEDEKRGSYITRFHMDFLYGMSIQYLQLGFDLQLYDTYEMPMIWWYLCGLASRRQKNHLITLRHVEWMKQKNATKVIKKKVSDLNAIVVEHNWFQMYLHILLCSTSGILKFLSALDWAGCFPEPASKFTSMQSRYSLRMDKLAQLDLPQYLEFAEFKSTYLDFIENPKTSAKQLLSVASEAFKNVLVLVKNLLNLSKSGSCTFSSFFMLEINSLTKIAITNNICINRLLNSPKLPTNRSNSSCLQVSFDYSIHKHFPVISFPIESA